MAQEPFLWGRAGSKLTPAEIAKEREVAASLAQGAMDYSPVAHWSQGLNRVAQGLMAGLDYRRADAAEGELKDYQGGLRTKIADLLAGGSSASSSIPMTSAAGEVSATSPSPSSAGGLSDVSGVEAYIREAAAKRGIDPDVAVRVARSEGLGPGIWQSNVVNKAGKRETSYGPFQLLVGGGLGDEFQRIYGKSPADPSTVNQQIDFALDKAAEGGWSPWYGAAKVGVEARTGLENARALGYQPAEVEVASLDPQAASGAIEVGAPASDVVDPMVSAPNYDPVAASAPTVPNPAPAPVSTPPVQVAQSSGINPAIIEALTDPRADEGTRRLAAILVEQQQAREAAAAEAAMKANDPLRQLQIQKGQLELEQMRQPQHQPLINAGSGAIYNPNTGEWLTAPGGGQEFRQATPEEAQKYGSAAGQFGPDGKFYPINPPQGTALSVGPNGEITFNQGAGVKPLTEAQSKDTLYATRATNALPLVDKYESELLSLSGNLAEGIPLNLGNYAQSEEYQVARDAGRDFLATILRKDTGAAITAQEEQIYGKMFLPQPGDKPAAIQAKRQRRALAVEAIKAGMPATAIENMAKALEAVPPSTDIEVQTDIPGVKIRRKN